MATTSMEETVPRESPYCRDLERKCNVMFLCAAIDEQMRSEEE